MFDQYWPILSSQATFELGTFSASQWKITKTSCIWQEGKGRKPRILTPAEKKKFPLNPLCRCLGTKGESAHPPFRVSDCAGALAWGRGDAARSSRGPTLTEVRRDLKFRDLLLQLVVRQASVKQSCRRRR